MYLIELLKNDWRNIFEMLLGGVKRNHYFPCIIWHQLSSTHMIIFDGNGLCLPTTTMHSLQNLAFCQICMPLWHFDQFYKRLAVTYQTKYILKMKILQIHFDTMFENLPKSRIHHYERT